MAEADYRISCRGCGVPVLPTLNKDGRLRKNQREACSDRCVKRKMAGICSVGRTCVQCGFDMQHRPLKSKHCSETCRRARAKPSGRQSAAERLRKCEACGNVFSTKWDSARFCRKACALFAFKDRHRPDRVQRRNHAEQMRLQRMRLPVMVAEVLVLAFQIVAAKLQSQCVTCGVAYSVVGRLGMRFCGDECARAAQDRQRRIERAARKAKERGAAVERVNPIAVFERDGWCCYLCGRSTPRELRGSYEPNAPELEHVVPLSRGGAHSYENCRCACRACNAEKGTKQVNSDLMLSGGAGLTLRARRL